MYGPEKFKVAFYKGVRPGFEGLYSKTVHWWTKTDYQHVEFVFSDGMSGSSSWTDGGVRLKQIYYKPEHWDFIDLPEEWEENARKVIEQKVGCKYDLLGNFGFILGPIGDSKDKYFCQEIIAMGVNLGHPALFNPGTLKEAIEFAVGVHKWQQQKIEKT